MASETGPGVNRTTIEAIHQGAFNAGVWLGVMIGAAVMAVAWSALS